MARSVWRKSLNRLSRAAFPLFQRLGFHVTPNHFYQPVPDTRRLPTELWSAESPLIGVDMNEAAQLTLLARFTSRYRTEYELLPRSATGEPRRFHISNGNFESVDAEILYCMVRELRPRTVIEIGSGFSTLLAAAALHRNETEDSSRSRLIACDPYLDGDLAAAVGEVAHLVRQPVQQVPLSDFQALAANDILFIDSSHVVAVGSDVCHEVLEILPRLSPGVVVHFHDIFLPAHYPRDWVLRQHRFWSEQYLLQAFLSFNREFEVVWAGSWMHLRHSTALRKAFGSYDPAAAWPASFWIRRRGGD